MAPYICIVCMAFALRLGKGWSNVIAAFCMYGLCYSVIWVDRFKVTSAGEHVIPIVTFGLVAIAGIFSLMKHKATRFIHGVVGIYLLVVGTITILSCHLKQFDYDLFKVHNNPDLMLPLVITTMFAGALMVFTKESA